MSFKIKDLVDYLNQNLEGKKYYPNKPQALASRYLKLNGVTDIEVEKYSYNSSGIWLTTLKFKYEKTTLLEIQQSKRYNDAEEEVFRRFEVQGSKLNKTFDDIIEDINVENKKRNSEEEYYLEDIQDELDSLGISYEDYKNVGKLIKGFYEEFYPFNDREGKRVLDDYLN